MKIKNKLLILLPILIITYWLSSTIAAPIKDKTKPVISSLTVTPSINNGVKPNIIKFKVSEPAKVSISIAAGSKVVKSYSTQLKKAGYVSWGWSGSKAAGTYTVRITAIDASKNSALKTSKIIIDKAKPAIIQHSFNLNPVKAGVDNVFNFKSNELVIGKLTISSPAGVIYTGVSGKVYSNIGKFLWKGQDQAGDKLPDGNYTYSLLLTDKAGNSQTVSRDFLVDSPAQIDISPVNLPYEADGSNVLDIAYNLSEDASVQVKIFKDTTLIRELFNGTSVTGPNSLTWDGKDTAGNIVVPGTYTLKITAIDSTNNSSEASIPIETTGISLKAAKSDGKDLVENGLEKAVIKLTLAGDTFKSTLLSGNFQLNNAPQGLIISSAKRTTDTTAEITLAFNDDFDTDINNFSITAKDTALTKGKTVTTGYLKITAVTEILLATKADGNNLDLTEKNLQGSVVRLTLIGDTYKSTVALGDIEFVNPPGTASQFGLSNIKRIDNNAIEITLSFSGDIESNINNFSIKVKGSALTSGIAQQTVILPITAVNELTAANQNGSTLALTENNLNGAKVRLILNDTTFKQTPLAGNIGLSLKTPASTDFNISDLTVSSVTPVGTSNNVIDLVLAYPNTTKDFDVFVADLQITVSATDLASNRSETTLPIPIVATEELQATNSDRTALNLNEKNLNGAIIRLNLTGGDTFSPTLNVGDGRTTGDIRLSSNAPTGLAITNINRVSTTEVLITLAFDSATIANDFDADITNFYFIAAPTALNSGFVLGQTTKKTDIKAFVESLAAAKLDGNPLNLVENNLNSQEAKIRLTLNGDTFLTGIDEGDFQLTNIPNGLTIASISRVNNNVVDLTLGYNTSLYDFDNNYNFTITALGSAVNSGRDISTDNPILLRALVETLVATKTDGNSLSLVESNLNNSTIRLNLSGATFKDYSTLLGKIQLSFNPAIPAGLITLGTINRINDSTVDITINHNGADFDVDYDMTIRVLAAAMNYSNVDLTDTVKITGLLDKVEATNADGTSTDGGGGVTILKRTTSSTAVVRLVLTDDKFQTQANLDASDFQLNLGLPITGVTRVSDTVVDLYLSGDFSTDVTGLTIQVKPTALTRNLGNLTTGSITISAS